MTWRGILLFSGLLALDLHAKTWCVLKLLMSLDFTWHWKPLFCLGYFDDSEVRFSSRTWEFLRSTVPKTTSTKENPQFSITSSLLEKTANEHVDIKVLVYL